MTLSVSRHLGPAAGWRGDEGEVPRDDKDGTLVEGKDDTAGFADTKRRLETCKE